MAPKRITILLGAGAMIEATGISTSSLTNSVIQKKQSFFNQYSFKNEQRYFLQELYTELCEFYPSDIFTSKAIKEPNFEDIFYALEILLSIITSIDHTGSDANNSVLGLFLKIKNKYKDISELLIQRASDDLVGIIFNKILEKENQVSNTKWFVNFFKKLLELNKEGIYLDIFSLNYDTWLEQILIDYNDGFKRYNERIMKFNSKLALASINKNSINHLHGHINLKEDNSGNYYKVTNLDMQKPDEIFTLSTNTQSCEKIINAPLVTGLRKADKLLLQPFNVYHTHFHNCLINNDSLLVIGYGYNDLHINSSLDEYYKTIGNSQKLVMIDCKNDTDAHSCYRHYASTKNNFIYNCFKAKPEEEFIKKLQTELKVWNESIILYQCGFKMAAENYCDEIINHLIIEEEAKCDL